jgi:type 1 glutamine amidotransferase/nicotinamidase-related amidase
MISGCWEYESDKSLAKLKRHLEARYEAHCTMIQARSRDDLPGLKALDACDVALFFTRRLTIDGEQLERVRKYCTSGRPIVAVRPTCAGFQKWLEFDKLVLGGNYHGHIGVGPTMKATIEPKASSHPVLSGVGTIKSRSWLYKTAPIATDAMLLMVGSAPALFGSGHAKGAQPVTWARLHNGGRLVYTSLGHQQDFENATFLRLLTNALFWAAKREARPKPLPPVGKRPKPTGTLKLRLRTRVETFKGSGAWNEIFIEKEGSVSETAFLICDMWDKHWCKAATKRFDALAKKMAPVVKRAREAGVRILHCPSETMTFYADTPQRRRMQLAPRAPLPKPKPLPDHPYPISVRTNGGCDCQPPCRQYSAWTRQTPNIDIGELDGVSDNGAEVYSFLKQQGINTVVVVGVATNMCVMARPFGIKSLARWGIRCILVRDLTDTMYVSKDPPHVSHDEGTELMVQHVEKHWCPSITSKELLEGLPAR